MNNPTREEFEDLKEEVKRLKKQITEPIKITRLEIDQGSMKDDVNVVKIEMQGARADIRVIKANQSDHGEYLKEDRQTQKHHVEKLDQHTEVLGQLLNFAESHDALLKTVATKEDLAALRDEQGAKLDRILKLLQSRD